MHACNQVSSYRVADEVVLIAITIVYQNLSDSS